MRHLWNTRALLLAIVLLGIPILAACAPTSLTPTPVPAKPSPAPKAEATKPAPEPTKQATPTKAPEAAKQAGAKAPSGDPIAIGFVDSSTGYMSAMGSPQRELVLAMEEKINAEGGVNGRPLKVIAYDDESSESTAVLAVKKLIEQDKVHAIIGPCATGIAMAVAPISEAAKVPHVTLNSGRAILDPPKKYVFKLPLNEEFYIEGMFMYLKEQKLTKVGLLTQGASFGREAKRYFEENIDKHGLKIVANEAYGPNDIDIRAPLTRIKAANPDALVVYGAEPAGVIAIRQAKEIGIKAPIVAPHSLTMPAIVNVKELRDGLEGVLVVGHKPEVYKQLPDSDRQKRIIASVDALIQKKYGHPVSQWEGNAYDAFTIVIEAAKRANVDPTKLEEARNKIRDAIEATKDLVGMSSIVSYSPTEHEIIRLDTLAFVRLENGEFRLVKVNQ